MNDLEKFSGDEDNGEYYSSFYWCLECEWSGHITECEVEYDWDEFKRVDVPFPICPECGGGVEF